MADVEIKKIHEIMWTLDHTPALGSAGSPHQKFQSLVRAYGRDNEGGIGQLCHHIAFLKSMDVNMAPLLEWASTVLDDQEIDPLYLAYNNPPQSLDEAVESFILSEFSGYMEFDPAVGALSITAKGKKENWSVYSSVGTVYLALRKAFPEQHRNLTKPHVETVLTEIGKKYWSGSNSITELENALKTHKHLFPKEFTAPLPTKYMAEDVAWEPILSILEPLFQIYGWETPREKEGLIRFLAGLSTSQHKPGMPMQWGLFLHGPGGTGKSVFSTLLALDSAPSASLSISDLDDKLVMERLGGASIAVMDELDVSLGRKRDSSHLKELLTKTSFSARMSYGRATTSIKRSWVYVMTANTGSLPDDGAGNRRYWPLEVGGTGEDGIKRAEFLLTHRSLLHAVSEWLYQNNYPCNISPDMVRDNQDTDMVESTSEECLIEEYLDSLGEKLWNPTTGTLLRTDVYGISQILTGLRTSRLYQKVQAILTKKGWLKFSVGGKRRVIVPRNVDPTLIQKVETLTSEALTIMHQAVFAPQIAILP